MSFDRYLEHLQAQEPTRESSPEEMAKTAGVQVPDELCNVCGGSMVKLGATMSCSCGYQKMAGFGQMAMKYGPAAAGGMAGAGAGYAATRGRSGMEQAAGTIAGGTMGAGAGHLTGVAAQTATIKALSERAMKVIEKGMDAVAKGMPGWEGAVGAGEKAQAQAQRPGLPAAAGIGAGMFAGGATGAGMGSAIAGPGMRRDMGKQAAFLSYGDGLPTDEQPQAMPSKGMPPQGAPPQGMPPQGAPPQGMPPQGAPPQGMPPQGMPPLDMSPETRQRVSERGDELDRLRRQTGIEAGLSPAGGVAGGLMGASLGQELGSSLGGAGRVIGGAAGGVLGMVGGAQLGDQLASLLQSRRETAQQALGQSEGHAKMGSLAHLQKRLKHVAGTGASDEHGHQVTDFPLSKGIPWLDAQSSLPVGPARKNTALAPNLGLTPNLAADSGAVQVGARLCCRPGIVPADSVVGRGLDAQRAERGSEMIMPIQETSTGKGDGSSKQASFEEALASEMGKTKQAAILAIRRDPEALQEIRRGGALGGALGTALGTAGGGVAASRLARGLGSKGRLAATLFGAGAGAVGAGSMGRGVGRKAALESRIERGDPLFQRRLLLLRRRQQQQAPA